MKSNVDVVQTFYKRAKMYDLDYADYTVDIPFNVQLAKEKVGDGKMLEFACGTGRITFELAKAGINVVGVDISPAMLEVAKEKLTQLGGFDQRVRFLEGDMRSFDAGKEEYQYVLIPFTSFLHLTETPSQKVALSNAYAHLVPGGYFLASVFLPDINHLARYMGPSWVHQEKTVERDGVMLVRWAVTRYDQSTQMITGKWYYQLYETSGDNKLLDSYWVPMELRVIFPAEWELLLQQAGFKIVEKWGGFNREPFDAESSHMLFLCQK